MKVRAYFCILIFVIAVMAGCSSGAGGRGENRVVFYTPFPDAAALKLAEAFHRKTGIEVDPVLDGTTKILARLRIEKRSPKCDVWFGGSGMIPFMAAAKEDLLDSYVPKAHRDIPYKKGNMVMRDRLWRWLPLDVVSLGYCYNPKILAYEDIPKTWTELADPKWKGQIEMWDPAESGTSMLFLEAALWRCRREDGDESEGWKYLRGVYNNLCRYTREGKPAFSVARGETRIGLHFENQYLEFLDQQAGSDQLKDISQNIAWYLPPESAVLTDGIALIKNCPHPENGRKFIDFCLSREGQRIINRYFFSLDPELGAPEGMKSMTLEDILAKAMPIDIDWMADNYDRVRKKWQNEIEAEAEQ